jgi:tetratricopeptide (TPR) repeat protein
MTSPASSNRVTSSSSASPLSASEPQQQQQQQQQKTSSKNFNKANDFQERLQSHINNSFPANDEQKQANKLIRDSYNLLWHTPTPTTTTKSGGDKANNTRHLEEAIELLTQAMKLQQSSLGKHHKDVGWTMNFIGVTYWQMKSHKQALKYFMEARRIMKKSLSETKSIDRRIMCLLLSTRKGMTNVDVGRFLAALDQMVVCEMEGDRLKKRGEKDAANKQYDKVQELSNVLQPFIK